jgi:hypothetical protein
MWHLLTNRKKYPLVEMPLPDELLFFILILVHPDIIFYRIFLPPGHKTKKKTKEIPGVLPKGRKILMKKQSPCLSLLKKRNRKEWHGDTDPA